MRKFHSGIAPFLIIGLVLLAVVACGRLAPPRTAEECHDRYDIGWVLGGISPAPETGSGVLEQRILQSDLAVWAELVDVEFKAIENEAVALEMERNSIDAYLYQVSDYKYTLVGEVKLKAREYLRGEGPDLLAAMVEGQMAFDSPDAVACAKRILEDDVGSLFGSREGIALLKSTSDPKLYHMGQAYENFGGKDGYHSTWLPYEDGSFDSKGSDGWINLADVRRRVSSVIEEYNRSDDDKWRNCVYHEYFTKDRDPWAYRGVPWPYHKYRDHDIIFNGEHVPVPAGAMVWEYVAPNYGGAQIEFHMRLEGADAHLFNISYYSEYEFTFNEWLGTSGGSGFYQAVWYKPHEGRIAQEEVTDSGYFITTTGDLTEGEYEFNLLTGYGGEDFVNCGQGDSKSQRFRVIVDKDRSLVPPAPTNVQVTQNQEGWTVSWDPVDGTDHYWVKVYRLDGDKESIDPLSGTHPEDPQDPQRYIRLSDMKGCGDVIYIDIWPHGDGATYLSDFGQKSEAIQLRTEPCPP